MPTSDALPRRSNTAVDHAPECFWLRANPSVDGDEGACCNCGAYEDRMLQAEEQRRLHEQK